MNTMKYKGYIGSVGYSAEDNVFFGKLEGVNGLINFEGDSVVELTSAFRAAVDDYLSFCVDRGIEPHKSYSGSLNVRLTPDLHSQLASIAQRMGTSINAVIKSAIVDFTKHSL